MKIIDLLNKIANGEEVPKKIKYDKNIYALNKYENYENVDIVGSYINWDYVVFNCLNEEVEIIEEEPRDIEVCGSWFTKSEYDKLFCFEEEKKIPEKLGEIAYVDEEYAYPWTKGEIKLKDKINEIIDYLKSKGDNK